MHTRSYRHLTAEERETVSLGLARGHPLRAMQITGRLRHLYPHNMRERLSAETIDAALYVLRRGALWKALLVALRQALETRRSRTRGTDRRGQIPNITPITERPAEVATRTIPGHWVGDLLKGARNRSAVRTLVERTTRIVILARMEATDATRARRGFPKKLRPVPASLRTTLTYDRGKGMAEYEQLAHRLSLQGFFADPATRNQREYQWPAASVLAEGHGFVDIHSARAECHCASAEYAPTERA